MPQQIRITVRRQEGRVVAVKVGSIFGEATLTRRELEEILAALQRDLIVDNQTIRLKPGLNTKIRPTPSGSRARDCVL